MRRNRRVWTRPEPSPLDRALNIGVSLPSYNFIEPKAPRRPNPATTTLPSIVSPRATDPQPPPHAPSNNTLDCDAIIFHTLLKWACDLDEPAMSEESKMARLWQSLLRHSEAGRFAQHTTHSPNPICSFMAMDLLHQVLEHCGVSPTVVNLLVGAVGNSIFTAFEPEKPYNQLKQYADVAVATQQELFAANDELAKRKIQAATHKSRLEAFQQEDSGDRSTQETVELLTTVIASVDEPLLVPAVITEAVAPFLTDELLLLLWNATAKATATTSLSDSEATPTSTLSIAASRKRASALASRVLQERVRLLLAQWQTLSAEEREVVAQALTATTTTAVPSPGTAKPPDGSGVRGVLRTLEEMYTSEQTRSSSRRSTFLSPLARHSSLVFRQPLATDTPTPPSGPRDLARPRRRMQSTYFSEQTAVPVSVAVASAPLATVSIPDVLLGALADGQHVAGTDEAQLILERLSADQDEILRQCEEIFDLLCVDQPEEGKRDGQDKEDEDEDKDEEGEGSSSVQRAKKRLCDLLCGYVDAPSFIVEKFEQSEARRALRLSTASELDDGQGTNAFVQALVQRQKQNPMVLVNAINQSPEILLSAVAQNNGILRFAMAKFAPLVKRFLRLDLKACEHLDMLAHKNKGVQLLWGTTTTVQQPPPPSRPTGTASTSSAALGEMFEDLLGHASPARGSSVSPAELRLLEWFAAHTSDLATLILKRPETLKPLFVELHAQGDAGAFYKVMLQLVATAGVQNYLHRVSVAALEKIAQEDPGEIARLLREIVREPVNRDILHQLQQAPYLATCLSEFHPTAVQDVIASDMDAWRHFLVETVAANDALLKECLVTKTEQLEGGESLVKLFSAVVAGATAGLNLEALEFGASPADVAVAMEREVASRRKLTQCVYLRGGSSVFRVVIMQLVASVGFHPHETRSSSHTHSTTATRTVASTVQPPTGAKARAKKETPASTPSKRRPPRLPLKTETATTTTAETGGLTIAAGPPQSTSPLACAMESMPVMWQSFVHTYVRHQHTAGEAATSSSSVPALSRAHAKTLILDIWIEFVKVDTLQLDNASVWSLAPFVCDFFLTRYDSAAVVGEWLYALVEAVATQHDDRRIAFFATCCGLRLPESQDHQHIDGYDTFLYYAHALGHLLLGEMKIFEPDRRLEETPDGSCFVDKAMVMATAARLFDHRTLSGAEVDTLMTRLEALPLATGDGSSDRVELDDVMAVFLDQWRLMHAHVDERYAQAFAFFDTARSNRIGLDQFTKIVASVTQQKLSPRECRLVYCDVGLEFMDLATLLHVTRVYHLRLFNAHLPELSLDERERHELALSVGRTNIFSLAREVEDLDRFWKGLRVDVQAQVDASHQTKTTKMHLKKQTALLDKLLHDIHAGASATIPTTPAGRSRQAQRLQQQVQASADAVEASHRPSQLLQKAWHELRACAKMIHSAKLTQTYLSRLYLQACLVRWIRQARKRNSARRASALEP